MESPVYNKEGKKVGIVALPERIFGVRFKNDLVHQVVVSMQANARTPVAHTKGRGDVRGGGIKPWRQKGTGRARHGSRRSPIWIGGGVTHGPLSTRDFSKKVNRKMRAQALFSVLSKKLADGEILFVDDMRIDSPKTADAKALIRGIAGISGFEGLSTRKRNAALIALAGRHENTERSFANFGNITVTEVRNLNPVDALSCKYIVIAKPNESVAILEGRMHRSEKKSAATR